MAIGFDRSEEVAALAESLRRFVRAEAGLEERRRRLAATPPERMALWQTLSEFGALGAFFSERLGGYGGAPSDVAAVVEALAPALLPEPYVAAMVSGRVLVGTSDGGVFEDAIAGKRVIVLAHQEGFDPFQAPASVAARSGGGFKLRGAKPAVRHADVATEFLITARLEDGETGVFRVPANVSGLRTSVTRFVDGAGAADLAFDGLEVAEGALVATGIAIVQDALEWQLMALCVETAAIIEAANVETFAYLNVREQFGQKLGQFQALQHRAADMAMAEQEAAAMAASAVAALDQAPSAARTQTLLAASLACDAAGRRVGHEAVQMFGGMGVSDELIISHYARRFAAIRAITGTVDARAARLAEISRAAA